MERWLSDFDGFNRHSVEDALRRAAAGLSSIRDFQAKLDVYRSPLQQALKQFEEQQSAQQIMLRDLDVHSRLREMVAAAGGFRSTLSEVLAGASETFREVQERAEEARKLSLPHTLEAFRTPTSDLSVRMLALGNARMLESQTHLDFFNQASALSDMIDSVRRINHGFSDAVSAFRQAQLPVFDSLSTYRSFFDGAGLVLPRWPKVRLLSAAEKRRRFRDRLKTKTEPAHVKRAKSLVHRYELTLRDILDDVMAREYGEDWPDARLPLCDCKDLLGKWKKRGGDVLEHADYAHYGRIMGHPDHFAAIFANAFADPEMVLSIMKAAGDLRAASHHGRSFTPEDLRDLRVTWKTIESGLLVLTDDYEIIV